MCTVFFTVFTKKSYPVGEWYRVFALWPTKMTDGTVVVWEEYERKNAVLGFSRWHRVVSSTWEVPVPTRPAPPTPTKTK
jgi:hypothetical protein